jgi:hypothetical protein
MMDIFLGFARFMFYVALASASIAVCIFCFMVLASTAKAAWRTIKKGESDAGRKG